MSDERRVQVNSEKCSWHSITVNLPHGEAIDITAISYDSNSPKTALYGKGKRPVGYSSGNVEQSGTMSLRREELLKWEKYEGKAISKIKPFPINVDYAVDDGEITNDVLKNCVITGKTGGGAAQNDTEIVYEVAFLILGGIVSNGIED